MERLYYIIAITSKDDISRWGRQYLCFVVFQWMLLIGMPVTMLNELSLSGKLSWFTYQEWDYLIKIPLFISLPAAYLLNYIFFFQERKKLMIIDKYQGKYQFIDKHPVLSLFIFHLLLPMAIFTILILISKYII